MNKFTSEDFRHLETFELQWRWTNAKWNELPATDLSQIHPLKETVSQSLWPQALALTKELFPYAFKPVPENLSPSSQFTSIHHFMATGARDFVRSCLLTCESHDNPRIIIMWEPAIAVVTSWNIFCNYWSDFCYPSSDDVCIWPISQAWFLFYYHEEHFIFGKLLQNST